MKSTAIKKRSIAFAGHRTSVSLEDEFWESLCQISKDHDETLDKLIVHISTERKFVNLSSAIRLFVLRYYRDRADTLRFLQTQQSDPIRIKGDPQTAAPNQQ